MAEFPVEGGGMDRYPDVPLKAEDSALLFVVFELFCMPRGGMGQFYIACTLWYLLQGTASRDKEARIEDYIRDSFSVSYMHKHARDIVQSVCPNYT